MMRLESEIGLLGADAFPQPGADPPEVDGTARDLSARNLRDLDIGSDPGDQRVLRLGAEQAVFDGRLRASMIARRRRARDHAAEQEEA
jgi:hypothetical protein